MPLLRHPTVFLAAITGLALVAPARAETEWVFSLVPNAFSKNPRLSLTVFTEFTAAGKESRVPTVQEPVWCVLFDAGRQQRGSAAPAREHAPAPGVLEKQLREVLAGNGYLITDNPEAHTPTIAVLMHWGSYTSLSDSEEEGFAVSPGGEVDSRMPTPVALDATGPTPENLRRRELVARAAVVGGDKFANDLAQAIVQRDRVYQATPQPRSNPAESVSGGALPPPMARVGGDVMSMSGFDMMDPLYLFENRDAKTRRLMSQARSSFYFVIASAFDYESLATPKRRLLWRTKMTVASSGVSMVQTLPVLIANSAPYVGREMLEPEANTRRVRDGKVHIGPTEVVGYEDEPGETPPAARTTKQGAQTPPTDTTPRATTP